MDPDQYIKERVDDQIEFYDSRSQSNQRSYKRLSGVQIVCGALIPLISGFSQDIYSSRWIIAFLGVAITCATGFLSINKHQERWINYRTTCETLKHLKHLFLTGATPYNGETPFDKFVNDIESMISKENSDWGRYIIQKKEG
ncbi:MAG: DUF4231 domain-containing protein [Proteobacteria bacterium]|nr:DUF4231 domain-containing protein [Pseudomonadota bacterium]MBU1585396.1 DUF4231 domain-containing protein [Pseudomonadota bacterium]MBU2454942.1 DUF4231 domain-containing protein [Pseudomonadota bacterium]MBU2628002.1 DUF4231 domain-containing protein [Pseudomonadota bacterium]